MPHTLSHQFCAFSTIIHSCHFLVGILLHQGNADGRHIQASLKPNPDILAQHLQALPTSWKHSTRLHTDSLYQGFMQCLPQVIAPVRETAAQAVGAAMQPLPACSAQALLALLHQLIKQQQWDVRHGGLLGLKYLLAARPHDSQALMPQALPAAVLGLQVCSSTCMPSPCFFQVLSVEMYPYWLGQYADQAAMCVCSTCLLILFGLISRVQTSIGWWPGRSHFLLRPPMGSQHLAWGHGSGDEYYKQVLLQPRASTHLKLG